MKFPVRALIAEDERLIALALRSRLESQGYEVVGIAGTGAEALALFVQTSPDIILMDVRMPEMDGIEATRALMQKQPVCVIIVSGSREPSQIKLAEEAGAMDYVVKPFESHQMRPVMERAQRRFQRFSTSCRDEVDLRKALESWLVVRKAEKLLLKTDQISEDEAHQKINQQASESAIPLCEAAENLLRNQEQPPVNRPSGHLPFS